jgi:hypothetical protein
LIGTGIWFECLHKVGAEDVLEYAIEGRRLDKVIIHPTLIPRVYLDAFRKGEIRVARLEQGFQIYEKTEKADVNVDYFPGGRQFLPPETRQVLIELAVAEAGLGDKVEVAFYRDVYNKKGFQGVIAEVKRQKTSMLGSLFKKRGKPQIA